MPDTTMPQMTWKTEYLYACNDLSDSSKCEWKKLGDSIEIKVLERQGEGIGVRNGVLFDCDTQCPEFSPNDFSAFVDRLVQFRDEHVKPLMNGANQ